MTDGASALAPPTYREKLKKFQVSARPAPGSLRPAMLRHPLPPALRLLTLAVVLLHLERAHPVLHGHTDDPDVLPLVALWGRDQTPASGVRCTGVFVAPESVLTSASCVLRVAPEGAIEDAACATGAPDCPVLAPEDLYVFDAGALPELVEVAVPAEIDYRCSTCPLRAAPRQ